MERLTYFNDAKGVYRLKPPTYTEDAVNVLAMYENIGTVSDFRELKEKATAKWNETQTKSPDSYYPSVRVCSNCNDYYTRDYREMKFCPNCGAKMTED